MTKSQYLKVGQTAKNRLFGIAPLRRLSVVASNRRSNGRAIQMLVSDKITISNSRLAVIVVGIFTLAIGIILSSIPWLDYIIMKNLKILNGTLSYHYWHKPGVLRLTKVFIFNVTNQEAFLNNGEKPRLVEIGPFVYREDMEKINTTFLENGTIAYQHNKVLQFMPELSIPGAKDVKFIVPNIPLLSLTTMANNLKPVYHTGLNLFLSVIRPQPFVTLNIDDFLSGYDDTLTALANTVFPANNRPPARMGLFLNRNGTLPDKASIFTGEKGWENFGYMDRLNGIDHLPYWEEPCNTINSSEGSFFPPRDLTKADIVYLYDKDLCRAWTMQYRRDVVKKGIQAGLYTPADTMFTPEEHGNNTCFCGGLECPPRGLQSISPCQYNAPLYLSFPHFLRADKKLLDAVEGLEPDVAKHEPYLKINSKLGVPLEARVRVQLNIMVEKSNFFTVRQFPNITFPVMWLEEGVEELPRHLQVLVYLSTTFADEIVPYITYGMIVFGALILVVVFLKTYRSYIFTTKDSVEYGKRINTRRSSLLVGGQLKLPAVNDSYRLLPSPAQEVETEQEGST